MLSNICVAITTGLPAPRALRLHSFCSPGTLSPGISTPTTPPATARPEEAGVLPGEPDGDWPVLVEQPDELATRQQRRDAFVGSLFAGDPEPRDKDAAIDEHEVHVGRRHPMVGARPGHSFEPGADALDVGQGRHLDHLEPASSRVGRRTQDLEVGLETGVVGILGGARLGKDEPWGDELGDVVEDRSAESPFEVAATALLPEEISRLLAPLDEREREILKLRFGLDRGEPRTLEEVGEHFNLTRERIRQIEARAMSKLRHPSSDTGARDLLAV